MLVLLSFASGGTGEGRRWAVWPLACVVLAAQFPGERGEFRRYSHHAADNHYGRWLDAFVR